MAERSSLGTDATRWSARARAARRERKATGLAVPYGSFGEGEDSSDDVPPCPSLRARDGKAFARWDGSTRRRSRRSCARRIAGQPAADSMRGAIPDLAEPQNVRAPVAIADDDQRSPGARLRHARMLAPREDVLVVD